jgi:cobalt-zinc-cadmium resistance protein CzcA
VLDAVEAMRGRAAGVVLDGERRYTLQVRLPDGVRSDRAAIERIPVGRPGGPRVPLGQVAEVSEDEGPLQISRAEGQRRITVEVNVRGRDVAGFVSEAQERVHERVDVPDGYLVAWGGTFENLEAASGRLAVIVPLVLLLIFVLLQANFGSVKATLLVYANVPLAVTGGLVALFLRGLPLSISAGVGFIALFGIAVMNGVVLVSSIRARHDASTPAALAAHEGAHLRLRPVLMTALVAAFGFLPMALAHSAGAEVQRPLATVVIGGLFTSTLLTLLVLPALYGAWIREPAKTGGTQLHG